MSGKSLQQPGISWYSRSWTQNDMDWKVIFFSAVDIPYDFWRQKRVEMRIRSQGQRETSAFQWPKQETIILTREHGDFTRQLYEHKTLVSTDVSWISIKGTRAFKNNLIFIDIQWLVKTNGAAFIFIVKSGNKFLINQFWPCLSFSAIKHGPKSWFLILWT